MNKHLVFVYGTLRQGGVRAMPGIFPAAKFIGEGNVSGRLYDLGAYPSLLLDASDSSVVGEVYEIDDETLYELDDIEASSDYRRGRVEVALDNHRMTSWIYVPDPRLCSSRALITSGDWIEYAKTRN